jgi:outer membrane protein assembly factor BamD (BamD/ComL family)
MKQSISVSIFTFALTGCGGSAVAPVSPPAARVQPGEAAFRVASSLYATAYRTKRRTDYLAAIDAYEKYIAQYMDSSHAEEANEFDAESRYAIEDWSGAALHFERAIAADPHAKDAEEMAYANVLATRYAAGLRDDGGDLGCTDEPTSPEQIPSAEMPLLAAYDLYLKVATADDEARATILFLKGRALHSCAHFSEAEADLADVVDHFSGSPEAKASAVLLLDCIAEQGNWAEMRDRVQTLDASPLASDPILADTIREVRAAMRKKPSS